MSTIYETIKAFGESRERELFGNKSPEEKTQLRTSYASLRSLIDPKFRKHVCQSESLDQHIDRKLKEGQVPSLQEFLKTSDATVLFPKVFQDTISEPTEPIMIGQDLFADEVRVEGSGSSIEWLSTGAIRARFVDEGEITQDDQLDFARHMSSARIRKAMVQIAITEEMVTDSSYDLIGLHTRASVNALRRLKEEWIWTVAQNAAYVVFDNTNITEAWKGATTGVGSDGTTANNTITHLDFVDLLTGPVVNGWNPDSIVFHPLHFPTFVKDPLLRELMSGAWPTNLPNPSTDAIQRFLPFALTAYMSPFVTTNVRTRDSANTVITASIMVLQRNEALVLFNRADPTVKEWTDPRSDVFRTNIRERYGVGAKHNGQAMAVAKGVAVTTNYGPVPLVNNI